jgi:hypothetical protein
VVAERATVVAARAVAAAARAREAAAREARSRPSVNAFRMLASQMLERLAAALVQGVTARAPLVAILPLREAVAREAAAREAVVMAAVTAAAAMAAATAAAAAGGAMAAALAAAAVMVAMAVRARARGEANMDPKPGHCKSLGHLKQVHSMGLVR